MKKKGGMSGGNCGGRTVSDRHGSAVTDSDWHGLMNGLGIRKITSR